MVWKDTKVKKKMIAGTFHYNSSTSYAVSSINPSTGLISSRYSINYTSFEKVRSIFENKHSATFLYNSDDERSRMIVADSVGTILTRWYPSENCIKEQDGTATKLYTFIGGDIYSAPVVAITKNDTTIYYDLLRDNLGNITHVVNSTNNQLVAEYSYDAWGRMRNPQTWVDYAHDSVPVLFVAGRGFTSHEHLPWFNLINMNGRVYDPLIGSFLSPDNNVQAPNFTQNLNRYSYCVNNPLKYTDETGEIWNLIIGGLIGGTFNWITHGSQFNAKGLKYFGVGALAGALGAGIGTGITATMSGSTFGAGFIGSQSAMTAISTSFTASFWNGAAIGGASGFGGGFVTGFGNGLVDRQNFGQAIWSGTKGGFLGGGSGALLGGLVDGSIALIHHKDFWDGDIRLSDRLELIKQSIPTKQLQDAKLSSITIGKNMGNANGRTFRGGIKSVLPDGEISFSDNKIELSRATIRGIWKGSIRGIETLNHELTHAIDYADGTYSWFFRAFGESTTNIIESRMFLNSYMRTGISDYYESFQHYLNSFWESFHH